MADLRLIKVEGVERASAPLGTATVSEGEPPQAVPQVVLIQPPLSISSDFVDYPYHCDLGVVQVAAVLREAGLLACVVDAFAQQASGLYPLEDGRFRLGVEVDALMEAVPLAPVYLLALSVFDRPPARSPLLGHLLERLRWRTPDAVLLLGDLYQSGQHFIEVPSEMLLKAYPEVDHFIRHEAEGVLPNLLRDCLKAGRPERPESHEGGEWSGFSDAPPPAWDLLELAHRDRFLSRVVEALGRGRARFPLEGRTLPALSSRGCPYRCVHCSSNPGRQEGAKLQRRLSQKCLRDHLRALQALGVTRIDFLDEMVNANREHFDALLAFLSNQGLRANFPNGMRADYLEAPQIEALAGRVDTLSVSAESGVQRVVDEVVGKALDLQRLEKTVQMASERHIPTLVHLIIGMPGETRAEINATLEFALHLAERYGVEPAVQYATPLPGTRLEKVCQDQGTWQPVSNRISLPVVEDYSPLFQHRPVTHSEEFDPQLLTQFRDSFDLRRDRLSSAQELMLGLSGRSNNRPRSAPAIRFFDEDKELPFFKTGLETAYAQGVRALFIGLAGEPTLSSDLQDVMLHAKRVGFERIRLRTNGRLASYDRVAAQLAGCAADAIEVELSGITAELHDRAVGVPGAFEQTCAGIRRLGMVCDAKRSTSTPKLSLYLKLTGEDQDLTALGPLVQALGLSQVALQFAAFEVGVDSPLNSEVRGVLRSAEQLFETWGERLRFRIVGLPWCEFAEGTEALRAGASDRPGMRWRLKADGGLEPVPGAQNRIHLASCLPCPRRVICPGFYRGGPKAADPAGVQSEALGFETV